MRKPLYNYVRICPRCDRYHRTSTKSNKAICKDCTKINHFPASKKIVDKDY